MHKEKEAYVAVYTFTNCKSTKYTQKRAPPECAAVDVPDNCVKSGFVIPGGETAPVHRWCGEIPPMCFWVWVLCVCQSRFQASCLSACPSRSVLPYFLHRKRTKANKQQATWLGLTPLFLSVFALKTQRKKKSTHCFYIWSPEGRINESLHGSSTWYWSSLSPVLHIGKTFKDAFTGDDRWGRVTLQLEWVASGSVKLEPGMWNFWSPAQEPLTETRLSAAWYCAGQAYC